MGALLFLPPLYIYIYIYIYVYSPDILVGYSRVEQFLFFLVPLRYPFQINPMN